MLRVLTINIKYQCYREAGVEHDQTAAPWYSSMTRGAGNTNKTAPAAVLIQYQDRLSSLTVIPASPNEKVIDESFDFWFVFQLEKSSKSTIENGFKLHLEE